ncbi:diaminopimelate epimerase [Halegenticoccus tardaugens]|uniref:diaminopimelate epimerase n=1 Tax=Halegenticoccus tardaugens TaxID=2071624 RepID=UPI00100AA0A2|nr:diaminopimelate epimerase [Halegenticoccus tardaugens]
MSLRHDDRVPFEKYHGTSNDFVIVDADAFIPNRGAFATTYCDRDTGAGADDLDDVTPDEGGRVGADGVLFLALEDQYSPPRVIMTLVQPDGSTAAMCGNGARCAAAWAAGRTNRREVMVDTQAGTRRARIHADGDVTIEMGVPSFSPRDVPLARDEPLVAEEVEGVEVTAVNTGVPHAVAFVDDVAGVDVEAVAPAVRHAGAFPRGANVTFASRTEDGEFVQRTFERGVEGETRSCGTGAVAVVAAAKRLGLRDGDGPVAVSPPGGELEITVPDRGTATLRGPVVREYAGELRRRPADGA